MEAENRSPGQAIETGDLVTVDSHEFALVMSELIPAGSPFDSPLLCYLWSLGCTPNVEKGN